MNQNSMPGWTLHEEVVERSFAPGHYTIWLRDQPMYLQGMNPPRHKRRFAQTVSAPRNPMYNGGLGASGGQIVGAVVGSGGAIAAKVAAAPIASALSLSTAAIPIIGVGIAALTAIFSALWSAHEARAKGATTENTACESAIQAWDAGMKAIFAAANSANASTSITAPEALQAVQTLWAQFWSEMGPYLTGPGRADASNGGTNCGSTSLNPAGPCMGTPNGHYCNSSCTVTCCVGCQDLYPTMLQAMQVFQAGGGTVQACAIASSKYGLPARAGYTLTYTPPPASTAAGAVNSIESALTGGGSGSSSTWLLVAAALAAFLLL